MEAHGLSPEHVREAREQGLYDYEAAYRANAEPDETGHWPSDFKLPNHPDLIVGGFHTQTLERVPGRLRADEQMLRHLGWDADAARALAQQPGPPGVGPMPSHMTRQQLLAELLNDGVSAVSAAQPRATRHIRK